MVGDLRERALTTFVQRLIPRNASAYSPTLVAEKSLMASCFDPLPCDVARFELKANVGIRAIFDADARGMCLNLGRVIQS